MPNTQIERSLSDLAITSLGDKLPGLMEYLLGFELVSTGGAGESSGARAAGILGFDIGGEQILQPVLFLNGQIKGNDCLYLKSSDTFISASPEWVEYLTSRSTGNPGEPRPGGRNLPGVPSESLRIFNQPPQISNSKYASYGDELDSIFEEFMNPQRAMSPASPTFNVPNVLRSMGKEACVHFMQHLLQDFPELLVKLADYYPGDELKIDFPPEPVVKTAAVVQVLPVEFSTLKKADIVDLVGAYKNPMVGVQSYQNSIQPQPGGYGMVQGDTASPKQIGNPEHIRTGVTPGFHEKGGGERFKDYSATEQAVITGIKDYKRGLTDPAGLNVDAYLKSTNRPSLQNPGEINTFIKNIFPKITQAGPSPSLPKIATLVEFSTLKNVQDHPELFSLEQKQAAFRGELIVIDKRAKEEKSETFSDDYTERFSAPTESGFYKMINAYGELEDVFIGYNSFLLDKPGKSVDGCTIIDPSSGAFYLPIKSEEVLVRPKKSLSDEEFEKSFNKLSEISSATMNKCYVAISPNRQVSAPFEVRSKDKSPNYLALRVDTLYTFESRMIEQRKGRPVYGPPRSSNHVRGTTVRIVDANVGKVTQLGDVICVPSSWRIMEIDNNQDFYASCCTSSDDAETADKKHNEKEKRVLSLKPGNISVLTQAIQDKNIKAVSVDKKAGYYTILLGKGKMARCTHPFNKHAALVTLVGRFGLSEEDANGLLKSADDNGASKCWVKMAAIYDGMPFPSYDNSAGMDEMGYPEQYRVTEQVNIPFNNPPITDGSDPAIANYDKIKQSDVDFLTRAADTNAKNVFDPAMIGQILKTSRTSAMIDKWLPDLVKAMDSSARFLLMFYWANAKFADMYGSDELSSLEDLLQENLSQLGKLVLFLKQKTVEGSSDQTSAFASRY